MSFVRLMMVLIHLSVIVMLSGCGSGSGDTDTSGSISVSATVSGSKIYATAKYVNSLYSDVSGLKIDFTTDHPELVAEVKGVAVDSTGTAVAELTITGVPSQSTINVIASTGKGGLKASAPVSLTLPGLALSLSNTTVSLGMPLIATATYSNPHAITLRGVKITFSSDKTGLFDPLTVETDDTGKATAVMIPKNTITAQTNAVIYATRDTQTQYSTVSVKPEGLKLSAPANASHDVESLTAGFVEFIPSGVESFAVLTTGDGLPLADKEVTISIQTIIGSTGTNVVFWENYPATPYTGTSITIRTDSTGKCPLQASVLVPFSGEAPDGKHSDIITVVWKVTYESPSGTIVGYASTMYTVNVTGPKEEQTTP